MAETTSLCAKLINLEKKIVADHPSAIRLRDKLDSCKSEGVTKDDVISQPNDTLVMLKTSHNEEKAKNTEKDDRHLQLNIIQ